MYGYVWICTDMYGIFTRKPPLSPTRNLLGIQRTFILKDVSKEFLGNHEIPTRLNFNFIFKVIFKEFRV